MPHTRFPMRTIALAAFAIAVAAMVGTGGCAHSSAVPNPNVATPSPVPSGSPTPTPSPTPTANYYVSMAYAYTGIEPTDAPSYGPVDGYALVSPPPTPVSSPTPTPSPKPSPTSTQTPGPSNVVNVPCNANIEFLNFDTALLHSAAQLVPTNGGQFPPAYNNTNGSVASPLLTPISFPGFNSGLVQPDAGLPGISQVYKTGAIPGAYLFGDYTDYNNFPSMRTVIFVNC
jgi:hypothetical protein